MRLRPAAGAAALAASVLAAGCQSAPKEQAPKEKSVEVTVNAPAMPSEEEMMKYMAERAALSDEHHKLAGLVGTWDAETTMYMGPQAMTSKGWMTTESVLGGRAFVSHFHGDMMGQQFEGMEFRGYDKEKKEHWAVWMDSMSTGTMKLTGVRMPDGSITAKSEPYDFMGHMYVSTGVSRFPDPDHFDFEMVNTSPGMPEEKMTIKYTRRR